MMFRIIYFLTVHGVQLVMELFLGKCRIPDAQKTGI